jgi:hypothetical protein
LAHGERRIEDTRDAYLASQSCDLALRSLSRIATFVRPYGVFALILIIVAVARYPSSASGLIHVLLSFVLPLLSGLLVVVILPSWSQRRRRKLLRTAEINGWRVFDPRERADQSSFEIEESEDVTEQDP